MLRMGCSTPQHGVGVDKSVDVGGKWKWEWRSKWWKFGVKIVGFAWAQWCAPLQLQQPPLEIGSTRSKINRTHGGIHVKSTNKH
jgi:hypothetical protein